MSKFKHLLYCLLFITALTSCNDTDDLSAIFANKGKKLTNILRQGSKGPIPITDFWPVEDIKGKEKSYELLRDAKNYLISFDGIEEDGKITGNFSAKGVNVNLTGSWKADGKSGKISLSIKNSSGTESDSIAKEYIEALKNVYKYKGDKNNLYLYYEKGQQTGRFLMFHNKKDQTEK